MAAVCGNCGGGMGGHAGGGMGGGAPMACGSCGFSTCGGCGAGIAPGMLSCGGCGWSWGRRSSPGLISDIATYEGSKNALQSIEDRGEGDSAEADLARAGMQASQVRLIVGGVGAVVAIVIFLIVLSKMHSANPNGLSPGHLPRLRDVVGALLGRRLPIL